VPNDSVPAAKKTSGQISYCVVK